MVDTVNPAKLKKSEEVNCGPLSDTMVCGRPSVTKTLSKASTVALAVVELIGTMYGKFDSASTTISHCLSQKGPAKSM